MPNGNILLPDALIIPAAQGRLTFLSQPGGTAPRPWIFRALGHSMMTAGQPGYLTATPSSSGGGDININLPGTDHYLIPLDHNWHGVDLLRVTQTPTPRAYTLYVYAATDWEENRREPGYAVGSSALDARGRWLRTIEVTPGKYHVVLLSPAEAMLIFPYVNVQPEAT